MGLVERVFMLRREACFAEAKDLETSGVVQLVLSGAYERGAWRILLRGVWRLKALHSLKKIHHLLEVKEEYYILLLLVCVFATIKEMLIT